MTPSARLALLLPLANRDELSDRELRRRVFQFLYRFEARGLRLPRGEQELWDVRDAPLSELRGVAEKLARVFDAGLLFERPAGEGAQVITADDVTMPLSFPSLRFGAFSEGRRRGAFTLMVEAGRLRDLVSYLATYLLTTEETQIGRCSAPKSRDWANECGRIFMRSQGGPGKPRLTCSEGCARRGKNKRANDEAREQVRRERRELQAQQRTRRTHRVNRRRR